MEWMLLSYFENTPAIRLGFWAGKGCRSFSVKQVPVQWQFECIAMGNGFILFIQNSHTENNTS